jgi:hypothetical protein
MSAYQYTGLIAPSLDAKVLSLDVVDTATANAVDAIDITATDLVVTGTTRFDFALPVGATPVSGTVYQNTSGANLIMSIPVTGTAAGTAQVALGPTSAPADFGGAETILLDSVKNSQFVVPSGWYWSITASGTTLGTASQLSF